MFKPTNILFQSNAILMKPEQRGQTRQIKFGKGEMKMHPLQINTMGA